jgi:hypothetical protein
MYSRLGTGISQENGGLNQVLRRVKPPTCMTVVNSSVILTKRAIKRDKSGKSSEWHLPFCYQNPPFSLENASTESGM